MVLKKHNLLYHAYIVLERVRNHKTTINSKTAVIEQINVYYHISRKFWVPLDVCIVRIIMISAWAKCIQNTLPPPPLWFIMRQKISLCSNIFFNFSFAFCSFWRISGSNWIGTLHTLFDFVAIGFYSFFNTFYLMASMILSVSPSFSTVYFLFTQLLHGLL